MSSTKFKVKQVKSGSETGLETFVTLPIDQEDTARLMPSQGEVDIGSSTINWGNAYLSDVECGEVACGTLAATGQVSALSASITESFTAGTGTFDTLDVTDTLIVGDDSAGNDGVIKCETITIHQSGVLESNEVKARDGNDLNVVSDISVIVDINHDGNNTGTPAFKVRKDFEAAGGPVDLLTLSKAGNLILPGDFYLEGDLVQSAGSNVRNDMVFKGIVECDPDSTGEGGFRSDFIGGSTESPNSVNLTTESSNGHFNSRSEDDGTFTVYGPRDSGGGKLQIVSNEIALYNGDTIFSGSGLELTKESIDGSDKLVPLLKNLHFFNPTNYYDLVIKPTAPSALDTFPQYGIAADTSGFTGCHRYIGNNESLELGDSVFLDNDLKCSKTLEPNSTKCVGIIIALEQCGPYEEEYEGFKPVDSLGRVPGDSGSAETMVVVASVGDSVKGSLRGFKVCNEGGEIAAGDLLVTSSVPGRLMKQADDVIRASTVGKAMQAVTFNDQGQADDVYGFLYCG